MSELVRLIEESLDGHLAVSETTGLPRRLRPTERTMITLKIANTLSLIEDESIPEKVALRRLLAATVPAGPADDRRVQAVVELLRGVTETVPREVLYVAISEMALIMLRQLGPIDFDPFERRCLVPELMETLRSVERLVSEYYYGYVNGAGEQYTAEHADVAERVLRIVDGI